MAIELPIFPNTCLMTRDWYQGSKDWIPAHEEHNIVFTIPCWFFFTVSPKACLSWLMTDSVRSKPHLSWKRSPIEQPPVRCKTACLDAPKECPEETKGTEFKFDIPVAVPEELCYWWCNCWRMGVMYIERCFRLCQMRCGSHSGYCLLETALISYVAIVIASDAAHS